ncbi:hypothetical protein, partial [Paenibacillus sp. NPDC058177]|uniref:hypothetical protein n=1 Tax=Paenibacillus sp. NPDC058177 TaxID=3346369 RepID=UPI0036DE2507
MNGKKSYLISFTALFSKKGYEVTFGVEQIINSNNWYHLTAPVNSTYKTLIEDTMKGANKVPHSATGLFGKLTNADNVTEYEGVGIDTAIASIVSYLSDIHRYFSGDAVVMSRTDWQRTGRRLDNTIDVGLTPMESGRETADNGVIDDTEIGALYDVNIVIAEDNRVTMSLSSNTGTSNKLEHAAGNKTGTIIEIPEFFEFKLDAEEGRAILSSILRQLLEGEISLLSQADLNSKISDSIIEHNSIGSVVIKDSEEISNRYAEIVKNSSYERIENAGLSVKDSSVTRGVLADTQFHVSNHITISAERVEVTKEASVGGLTEAMIDMVYNSNNHQMVESTSAGFEVDVHRLVSVDTSVLACMEDTKIVDTVNDATIEQTQGGSLEGYFESSDLADYIKAESLVSTSAYLSQETTVENYMEIDNEILIESEIVLLAVSQDYIHSDTIINITLQGTEMAELQQPIYDGKVDGTLTNVENRRDALLDEVIYYDIRIDSQPINLTAVDTYENSSQSNELVSVEVKGKNGAIHSKTLAEGSHRTLSSVDETMAYDTTQFGILETIEQADSSSYADLTFSRGQVDTRQDAHFTAYTETDSFSGEIGRVDFIEWAKVEMDYDSYLEFKDTEASLTKNGLTVDYFSTAQIAYEAKVSDIEWSTHITKEAGEVRLTSARNTADMMDGEVERTTIATPLRDYDAEVEHVVGATLINGDGADIQIITNSEVYVGGQPLIDLIIEAKNLTTCHDSEVEEFTEFLATEQVESEVQSFTAIDQMKSVITESPEILKAVRLLEIMYGSKAVDYIEAGMTKILQDSISGEFLMADLPLRTSAVIEQIKMAGAGVTTLGINQESSLASRSEGADILQPQETALGGMYVDYRESVTEEFTDAQFYDFSRPMDIEEMSHAILGANNRIGQSHDLIEADNVAGMSGTRPQKFALIDMESEADGMTHEIEMADIQVERGGNSPEEIVTAKADRSFEGYETGTTLANMQRGMEGVIQKSSAGEKLSNSEGTTDRTVTAASGSSSEGVLPELESATTESSRDGVLPELERANHSVSRDAVIAELESATAESSRDGVFPELERANHSVSRDAVIAELEGATSESSKEGVLPELERANHSVSRDAVIAELEGATSESSKEGVLPEL